MVAGRSIDGAAFNGFSTGFRLVIPDEVDSGDAAGAEFIAATTNGLGDVRSVGVLVSKVWRCSAGAIGRTDAGADTIATGLMDSGGAGSMDCFSAVTSSLGASTGWLATVVARVSCNNAASGLVVNCADVEIEDAEAENGVGVWGISIVALGVASGILAAGSAAAAIGAFADKARVDLGDSATKQKGSGVREVGIVKP